VFYLRGPQGQYIYERTSTAECHELVPESTVISGHTRYHRLRPLRHHRPPAIQDISVSNHTRHLRLRLYKTSPSPTVQDISVSDCRRHLRLRPWPVYAIQFRKSEGIVKVMTMSFIPQCNGVIEWASHTFMECIRCLLDDAALSNKYWALAVSVAVYLKDRMRVWSVVGKTPHTAQHGRKIFLKHLRAFGSLAYLDITKKQWKKLDYKATLGIFVGYCISTTHYFLYNLLAKTRHHSRGVVSEEWKQYTAANAADEAMWNKYFYGNVISAPKPTATQPIECQTEESSVDKSPLEPLKLKKKSQEMAGHQTSLRDACKPPAEGSGRNRTGKLILAQPPQLAFADEEFEDLVPIYFVAAISNNHIHKDGINDPKS